MKTNRISASFRLSFLSTLILAAAPAAHGFGSSRKPASAPATETHYLVTLGDSISAGFIGYTQVDPDLPPAARTMGKDGEPPPPNSLAGIRYAVALESKKEWSWATGSKSNSIALRLERWLRAQPGGQNRALAWLNQAESGAIAMHLPRQARLAAESLRGVDPDRVALVTLLIGANDACDGDFTRKRVDSMKTDILGAAGHIARLGGTRTRVFISSIPNIPDLSQPHILQRPAEFGLTCQNVRDRVVNFCPSLLNWSTSEDYQKRAAHVRFVNQTLRSAAEEAGRQYANLDVHFDTSFYDTVIPPDHLAYDCFHPGRDGQKKLADLFWNAMGWFR